GLEEEADGDSKDDDKDGEASKQTVKPFRGVRLIMRQDQTHRVILNTVLLPAMQFQIKETLKSTGVLFAALDGPEATPINVHMKVSGANGHVIFIVSFLFLFFARCRFLLSTLDD